MSLSGDSTKYLIVTNACGATMPYLDHIWAYVDTSLTVGSLVTSGESNTSQDHARSVRSSSGSPNYAVARSRTTGSNNSNVIGPDITGTGASIPIPNTWNSYSGAFVSTSLTRAFCNGAAGTDQTNSNTVHAAVYTRIFGDFDNTSTATSLWHCEWSRWNIAGYSDAQIQALVTALSTITNDAIPNANTIHTTVGSAGYGKCVMYCTLKDRTAQSRTDRIGGSIVLAETGSWGDDQVHPHPTVDGVYPPSLSGASANPMVQGTSVTITGTNLKPLGVTAPTVTYNGTAVTLTSSSNTQIVFTPTEPVLYGVAYPLTLLNETGLSLETEFRIATIPASGETYWNITETVASSGLRISDTPDIDIGSQVHTKLAIQDAGGLDTAMTITDVIVEGDGTIAVDTNPDVTFRVDFQRRTSNGTSWTSFSDVSVTLYADTTTPVLIGDDTITSPGTKSAAFSLALIDLVTATATWTWTRYSGDALPTGLSLNSSTGAITGTPTVAGTSTFVIRATGSGGYVAITVTIIIAAAAGSRDRSQVRVSKVLSRTPSRNPLRWIIR